MGLDHLGPHTLDLKSAEELFARSVSLVECSPPLHQDPRTHLNGPFVSIRKIQKHQDAARLEKLQARRTELRKLIECDRQQYQCELQQQGLTLYTDTLL